VKDASEADFGACIKIREGVENEHAVWLKLHEGNTEEENNG
jgi:hypothetical protein